MSFSFLRKFFMFLVYWTFSPFYRCFENWANVWSKSTYYGIWDLSIVPWNFGQPKMVLDCYCLLCLQFCNRFRIQRKPGCHVWHWSISVSLSLPPPSHLLQQGCWNAELLLISKLMEKFKDNSGWAPAANIPLMKFFPHVFSSCPDLKKTVWIFIRNLNRYKL